MQVVMLPCQGVGLRLRRHLQCPHALESYATVFEQEDALERLEGFASLHGPRFYGLPVNEDRVTLRRCAQRVPVLLHLNDAAGTAVELVPFHADELLGWSLEHGEETGSAT